MPKYDEEDYEYFSKKLRIKRQLLDEEMIEQPNSFFHVAEGYVQWIATRDQRKHDLEVAEAEVDKDIRDDMGAENEKVTEALVKAAVKRDQKYHRAVSAYLAAAAMASRWEALRNSFQQRAYILRDLTQLHIAGYFGEITGVRERQGARERFQESRRAR